MTQKKKTKATANKRADATKNYLMQQYNVTGDTASERVLGLVSDSIDPFAFVGKEVTENPDVEWYCGNGDDRLNIERAKRQGWRVLEGDHSVQIQAGRQENHVYMYRPKTVGARVRHAENAARSAEQGIKHETNMKREQIRVNVEDPYGMD